MNLQHLRYMAEVEKAGSVTGAAANLFMGQPNLSKAIKEVENEIGITVFNRSARGVFPTPKGAEFLRCARAVLEQFDKIEAMYRPAADGLPRLGICAPPGGYINAALGMLMNRENICAELIVSGNAEAADRVSEGVCSLGVLRFPCAEEDYYSALLGDKGLTGKKLREFEHSILVRGSAASEESVISAEQLEDSVMIVRRGSCGEDMLPRCRKRLLIGSEADGCEMAAFAENSFIIDPDTLSKRRFSVYGLVRKKLADAEKYMDMLIFQSLYKFSEYEKELARLLYAEANKADAAEKEV
ncbi:MAG: LysR family transcriptional regulator [Ruminococcus sp.]|nr:LysR family transcriptional regulator [Ruminococcus sp.]